MTRSPSVDIVEAIANAKGITPQELDPPLHQYIDTDAIRLLESHETASWTLSFELPDHKITVTSEGLILVDGVREGGWARPSAASHD